MAGPARPGRRLDAFLRRRLAPAAYERVRACELCVVGGGAGGRALRHVVLSDRRLYLAEHPPRRLRRVAALRDVAAIELIDDYPEFLSPRDRETNQHIRIIYYPTALKKESERPKGVRKFFPFPPVRPNGKQGASRRAARHPRRRPSGLLPTSPVKANAPLGPSRCPGSSGQSTPGPGRPASTPSCRAASTEPQGPLPHKGSPREAPFRHGESGPESVLGNASLSSPARGSPGLEKKQAQLHLYIVSRTSSMYLHLRSSWNNYIIKATLLQDPLYASALSSAGRGQRPYRSEEKMKYFSQLKSELFLKDNTLRKTVCLVTELKAAAQKNFILKRLFWKTSDLFHFLVDKLHEYLPESRDKNTLQNKSQRADELVACIEIVQTLGLMFRETETESSRLSTLAAKKGILFNLLVILISEPQIPKSCPVVDIQLVADSTLVEMSFDAELQKLLQEYTDTATALLFEILLVSQQGNLGLGPTLAIGWVMSFLQGCPPIVSFVASMVKQMVKGLSAPCQLLSPGQAVLLYQRFYILKSCLQYSGTLAEHIRNDYTEEFRYFIHGPALERRLPPCYPVAPLTAQLLHHVRKLLHQKQREKC
ncbi:LOW QUALITY PROTEIN: uncharacterized protein C12orf56 homolog [Talpa occidentalis]|uniref:LOW QUALITY PROTEIN: uncharacterized protein C12orf56 homolog n=1 Tax=Talpa occidentalis TaxID=50954 RepID=UPI0023F90210|nr:LOW QUALITY PROTEIN: uncharacterized protein C12orf56 homolog [Talpa occidentalis]